MSRAAYGVLFRFQLSTNQLRSASGSQVARAGRSGRNPKHETHNTEGTASSTNSSANLPTLPAVQVQNIADSGAPTTCAAGWQTGRGPSSSRDPSMEPIAQI